MRALRWSYLWICLVVVLAPPEVVWAGPATPPDPAFTVSSVDAVYLISDFLPEAASEPTVHVVRPGETLFAIARRYGTSATVLARLNGIADPRQLYVGQELRLIADAAETEVLFWEAHRLGLGEEFSLLARRSGVMWRDLALVNNALAPGTLLAGQEVRVPGSTSGSRLMLTDAPETWLGLALRHDLSMWEVVERNALPLHGGGLVLLPGEGAPSLLPYPVRTLELSPQPISRGQTAVLVLETEAPVHCEVIYLDRARDCLKQGPNHYFALVSFSPMLEPDAYPLRLHVQAEGGAELAFELPLVVTAGRYGFERINVSSLGQLFSPELLQNESELVDTIANIRSPYRHWELPFDYPLYAAVSSYFGSRRSYGGSYNSYHSGVDFRAATGTPVRVPAAGTVILAEDLTVRGNAIIIDHGWGVLTGYWHLSRIEVEEGERVNQGQIIGRVGNTGLSTGAHLHWQIWVDGTPVDPLQWTQPFYDFPPRALPDVTGVE